MWRCLGAAVRDILGERAFLGGAFHAGQGDFF